jgi:cytochrome c oxidase subunit 2
MTGPARTRLAKQASLALGLVVAAAGCASNAPQDTLQPEGPQAQTIHNLVLPVFGIAGIVFVLILGGALWVSLKFRAKDDDDFNEFPEQVHGNFRLEIGWTILPAVVLAVRHLHRRSPSSTWPRSRPTPCTSRSSVSSGGGSTATT